MQTPRVCHTQALQLPCALHAPGQGPAPASPSSSSYPMEEHCTGKLEAWRPVCPQKCLQKAAKWLSSKCCMNTLFQGETAAPGPTVPQPVDFCSLDIQPQPWAGPPTLEQACPGKKLSGNCPYGLRDMDQDLLLEPAKGRPQQPAERQLWDGGPAFSIRPPRPQL